MHELKRGDPERRLAFAEDYLTRVELNPEWIDTIFWTDEAHFTLSSQVNTWNSRIWANENPHMFVQEPLHDEKVTVWCGVTSEFIIGPNFFEEVNDNGQRYQDMLQKFIIPQLVERGVLDMVTFMQDGAPPHFVTRM